MGGWATGAENPDRGVTCEVDVRHAEHGSPRTCGSGSHEQRTRHGETVSKRLFDVNSHAVGLPSPVELEQALQGTTVCRGRGAAVPQTMGGELRSRAIFLRLQEIFLLR